MRLSKLVVKNIILAVLVAGMIFILGCSGAVGNTLTGLPIAGGDAIKKLVSCTETDRNTLGSGNNPLRAGTTTAKYTKTTGELAETSYYDLCTTSGTTTTAGRLNEYYCDGNRALWTTLNCEQYGRNYVCRDNACAPRSSTS